MIREYSVKRDGEGKVSKHFRVREFSSKDGADKVLIDDDLVKLLENIREAAGGKSVTINSGYRSPEHNKAVGGVSNSQHVKGTAADIVVADTDPLTVGQIAEYFLNTKGGIGVYKSFTHVDTRANRSRWDQRSGKQVVVSGWPGWEEPEMTQAQFDSMMEDYLARLAQKEPSDWSKEEREWCEDNGLIKGDENGDKQYKMFVTREQMAVFMKRLAKRL